MAHAWGYQSTARRFGIVDAAPRQRLDKIGTTSLDFSVYLNEFEGDAGSDYLHQILQPAMRFEPEIFVTHEIFRGSGSLAGLLTANHTFITGSTSARRALRGRNR